MGARGLTALGAVGVGFLTALVFWPAVGFEWLKYWDDGAHLLWNEAYKGLTPTHLWWMLHPFLGQWMPLTWLSWALDYTLWGLDPAAFHRTNVLLHALNAGVLFLVARRLLPRAIPSASDAAVTLGALAAALLWALHPLRVESVAWVNERRDVLSGLFYLLAILTYLVAVERPNPYRRWLAVSVACFALAVLSKGLAVTLPVVLLLLDYYPLGRRRFFLEKLPYVAVSAVGVVMAFVALAKMDVIAPLQWISLEDRVLIAAYSVAFYLLTSLWPAGLSPLYELTFRPSVFEWRFGLAVIGVGAVTWMVARSWRSRPVWAVVWFAYAVSILPVSGIVQNGFQLVALRYSYLATLPLALLAGGLLMRVRPAVGPSLATASVGILVVLTGLYLPVFHDGPTFWTRAVQVQPACVACADFLVHQAKLSHAEAVLTAVLAEQPELQEQRFQLGMIAFIRARGAEGERHFREYLRRADSQNPGYIPRIEVGRQQHVALARHVLRGPQRQDADLFDGTIHGLLPRP